MSSALLIRCLAPDSDAHRLARQLESYFGASIYFMIDNYSDEVAPAIDRSDNIIRIGRRYLTKNGLPYFSKVGWQCGDLIYYAAADELKQYNRFWLVEPDVFFGLDPTIFFNTMDAVEADFLGVRFGKRDASWWWYQEALELGGGAVYGSMFPMSRLSRRAANHLRECRAKYTAKFGRKLSDILGQNANLFANDESFVATTLMRDGFFCRSMNEFAPEALNSTFHTLFPTLEIELSRNNGKIMHPFCDKQRARKKFALWMRNGQGQRRSLQRRMQEIIDAYGEDAWIEYSGIDPDQIGRVGS